MPVVKRTKNISNLTTNNQSPYSLSAKIKDAIDDLTHTHTQRERERAKLKLTIVNCSHSCSQCQWGNTPTPSTDDKKFVWNINLNQENLSLLAQLEQQKILYEELQDQTQRKILELKGEIGWYRQQNTIYQDNGDELWKNYLEDLEKYLEQKEQTYKKWEKELQNRLDNCCQTELKLEELLNRYKKGKLSWEQRANLLDTELQQATAELEEQVANNVELTNENESLRDEIEELLDDLAIETNQLKKELNRQSQANRKKKKKLKRTSYRLKVAKQDKQNLQTWKDNHTCSLICQKSCCLNNDYNTIKQERDTYQSQLATKDQKIAELEQIIHELRNKPPIQPINNSDKSNNSPKQEPNNFLIKKNNLLNTIQQQKETIAELQTQLSQTNIQEPQIIVKEVPVENLTTIQQLKKELKNKEQTITQLHLIYLLILGVSVLVLTYTARIIKKKNKLKRL